MKSATQTAKKFQTASAVTCYACDAQATGLAFQWVGGVPQGKAACPRHAWEKKNWPAER